MPHDCFSFKIMRDFQCCICGERIEKTRWEPLSISVREMKESGEQYLWSHVDCFHHTLHQSIPFASLQDRVDIYDSWQDEQVKDLEVGQLIDGSVSLIRDSFIGIDLGGHFNALLHISNISQIEVEHPNKIFHEGDRVRAVIVSIDKPRRRVSLSTSDLEPEPGDMLRDPEQVYDSAGKMADRYCRNVLGKERRCNTSFATLTPEERHVIYQCLKAAAEGPFFPDWEFQALFGMSKNDVARLIALWPDINHAQTFIQAAINSSINNLLGYPHNKFDIWHEYISADPAQLAVIFQKWSGDDSFEPDARGYFNRMM